jgi:hypothetical protein
MSDEKNAQEQYDPPEVEQIPTDSGPAVTAAGKSPPEDDRGPEWRPEEKE